MTEKPESFQDALNRALKKTMNKKYDTVEFGKIPPQATDIEKAILGAIMSEKDALSEVITIINENTFYKDEHKEIFKAILELNDANQPIDILTVVERLQTNGKLEFVGGPYGISELTNRVGQAANIGYHARILKEKFILRELIRMGADAQRRAFDPVTDAFDLLDELTTELSQISDVGSIKDPTTTRQAQRKVIEAYESSSKGAGVVLNINQFDRLSNGFDAGDFVIIAARPSMGKTALALEIAKQTTCSGIAGAIFSMEMSETQLMQRLIANYERIPLAGIKNKNLEPHLFEKMINTDAVHLPLFIDDSFAQTVSQIKAKATKLKKKYDIGFVLIDYLQLIKPSSRYKGNKVQEIGEISRALKGMAKDLQLPVICLSQLSRAVEQRGNKRPILSDLRESGDIEQDADFVAFIYREDYYTDEDDLEPDEAGKSELIIAKNRNGETGTAECRFIGKYQAFIELHDKID